MGHRVQVLPVSQVRPQPTEVYTVLPGLLLQRRLPAEALEKAQARVPGCGGRPGPARAPTPSGARRAAEAQCGGGREGGGQTVRDLPGQAEGAGAGAHSRFGEVHESSKQTEQHILLLL